MAPDGAQTGQPALYASPSGLPARPPACLPARLPARLPAHLVVKPLVPEHVCLPVGWEEGQLLSHCISAELVEEGLHPWAACRPRQLQFVAALVARHVVAAHREMGG